MLTIMKIRIIAVFACILAIGCENHDLEEKFFKQPLLTRVERMRRYPLADQYKIFRYGNDMVEPPLMDLADPISERGSAAVPFLLNRLNSEQDDIAVRDILLIFETMARSKSYDVRSDAALMIALDSRVSKMKDQGWRDICLKRLQWIKDSG
jgi:hypothetical protein